MADRQTQILTDDFQSRWRRRLALGLALVLPWSIAAANILGGCLLAWRLRPGSGERWPLPKAVTIGGVAYLVSFSISNIFSYSFSRFPGWGDAALTLALVAGCGLPEPGGILRMFALSCAAAGGLGVLQYAVGLDNIWGSVHGISEWLRPNISAAEVPGWILRYVGLLEFRAHGAMAHPLTYAQILGLGVFAIAGSGLPRRWKAAAALLILAGLTLSRSRWPALGIGAAGLPIFWIAFRKGRLHRRTVILLAGVAVALAGLTVAIRYHSSPPQRRWLLTDPDRWRGWMDGLRRFPERPLLGFGSDLGAALRDRRGEPLGDLHSMPLSVLLSQGLVGWAAAGLFLAAVFRNLFRQPESPVRLACFGALLYILWCGLTESNLLDDEVAIASYFLIGLGLSRR